MIPTTHHRMMIVVVGIFLCLYQSACNDPDEEGTYALTSDQQSLFNPGDIILRRGKGLVSDGIAQVLNEPYNVTHCGLLVPSDSGWAVMHALSDKSRDIDGVVVQALGQFVEESKQGSIMVVRYKAMNGKEQAVLHTADGYLKKGLPFDLGFDIHDTTAIYCSELLQKVYMDNFGEDIFPIRIQTPTTELLKYTYLFDTTHFERVLEPEARN